MAVQEEIQWLSEETNKGNGNEGGIRSASSEGSSLMVNLFLFFSRPSFTPRILAGSFEIWKRGKKEVTQEGREESASYETLARVTLPFTLHSPPVPFLRIPFLSQASMFLVPLPFRGTLFSPKRAEDGTSRACNLILVKSKVSMLLRSSSRTSPLLIFLLRRASTKTRLLHAGQYPRISLSGSY